MYLIRLIKIYRIYYYIYMYLALKKKKHVFSCYYLKELHNQCTQPKLEFKPHFHISLNLCSNFEMNVT